MSQKEKVSEKIRAKLDQEQKSLDRPKEHTLSEAEIYKACISQQDGDAWLYCRLYRDLLCYDHAAGKWYEWKGHYWAEDKVDNVIRKLDAVIDLYAGQASNMSFKKLEALKKGDMNDVDKFEEKEKHYLKKIACLQKRKWKEDVLKLAAAGESSLGISGEEWDKGHWLLGCQNGVIELKTGTLRPGKPDDYIKSVCPSEWKGIHEPCAIWENSLLEIFDEATALIDFIQRIFGYSITGDKRRERIFPIFEGPEGQNGKGTILETILEVLGPHLVSPIEAEMLLDQGRTKSSTGPSADIMDLRGKRIVWASETNEGRRFNLGKVKWMTGGDTLKGRTPFAKSGVSFQVTHTLFLITNHRPKADPNDNAFWKRVFLIPFYNSFVDNPDPQNPKQKKADFELPEKLKAEASGILAWLVRGCLEWQKQGLNPPDLVMESTREYQKDEDIIGYFMDDCCVIDKTARVRGRDIYGEYTSWCNTNGHKSVSGTKFGKLLKTRFRSGRDGIGVFYYGIGLLSKRDFF